MTEEQSKKLQKYLELLESTPEATLLMFDEMEGVVMGRLTELENKVDGIKPEKGDKGDPGRDGKDGEDYILTNSDKKEIASKIEVPVVERVIERTEVIKEQPIVTQEIKEVAVTDTGEKIVKKINDLPTEEDLQIGYQHIKGLEDEIKKLRKEIASKGGGSGRRVFQPHRDDFTAQTDGSTKIFTLSRAPLDENTVMVFGTDFPIILKPTTDFTVAGKTLTLTSAVPAPSQGATLIVFYFA